jgi:hypothetical protein
MLPARRPYEDELLSSAVLRCCRQFNVTEWRLGTVVLRQSRWRLSFLGVSALSSLSELFRQPPERLLWGHTAFPYVSAMMAAGLYERTVAEAISDKSLVCWPSALLQRLTAGLSHRRFCQQCAEEELSRYRESYWHREHHLPGVWLCVRHGTALRQTNVPVRLHRNRRGQSLVRPAPIGRVYPTFGRITHPTEVVWRLWNAAFIGGNINAATTQTSC